MEPILDDAARAEFMRDLLVKGMSDADAVHVIAFAEEKVRAWRRLFGVFNPRGGF